MDSTDDSSDAALKNIPPVDPNNVLDLIFASTSFSSGNERQQQLGEFFLKDYFRDLYDRYADDHRALLYLQNLQPVIGSALRAFAVEKQEYKRRILPKDQFISDLKDEMLTLVDSIPLSSGLHGLTGKLGLVVTTAILSLATAVLLGGDKLEKTLGQANIDLLFLVAAAVVVMNVLYFFVGWGLICVKTALGSSRIRYAEQQVTEEYAKSFERMEGILVDALMATVRLCESIYPEYKCFGDGHLFAHDELPYLPVYNQERFEDDEGLESRLSQLQKVVQSRISSNPKRRKMDWYFRLVEDSGGPEEELDGSQCAVCSKRFSDHFWEND
ncbi:hypothetical protein FIV42_05230 [Persicimonas caeni]|uniref:Uncharacterized protein n=1 Tax=Persicimonas caeni TaxID=2292766 RepID=A0A4Y6PQV0_PERCE|nr:hypothetical protein [Persicimonas caeni]QDG50155.1 hypothetical protein FIV42_05230 [Persicimonas caeni]QED31376.1 hypothetical protein FRD00_05225 [Persicimonas caeni]